jgi:hypothetical integral membrane protein (TIGR02206 family)
MAFPLNQAAWMTLGIPLPLDNILPLHLCDIAAMTAGFALLTRHPALCALTYFWGLAATLQALLTPAIGLGFPSWPFITFFIQHFAIVAAALYLPVVEGWRPKRPLWKATRCASMAGRCSISPSRWASTRCSAATSASPRARRTTPA